MIVVQKFGGVSVANIEKIKHSASIVQNSILQNIKIVVVVSAFAGKTDELIQLFSSITKNATLDKTLLAERDAMLSTGEQVCASLFAAHLNIIGIKAQSFNSLQTGIFTDKNFSNAKISSMNLSLIKQALENNITPVITGFQGYSLEANRITTLGRGGSDTSAIAIAAALNATKCEIYKDVKGILTGEPKIVQNYKKIDKLEYATMLEFAGSGAKVIETRAVQFGAKYGIPISVLPTFLDGNGTEISKEINEKSKITGVSSALSNLHIFTSSKSITQELQNLEDKFASYKILAIESTQKNKHKFLITLPLKEQFNIPNQLPVKIISVVGYFLKSDKILNKVLSLLNKHNVNQILTTISETKISIIVPFETQNEIINQIHYQLIE